MYEWMKQLAVVPKSVLLSCVVRLLVRLQSSLLLLFLLIKMSNVPCPLCLAVFPCDWPLWALPVAEKDWRLTFLKLRPTYIYISTRVALPGESSPANGQTLTVFSMRTRWCERRSSNNIIGLIGGACILQRCCLLVIS